MAEHEDTTETDQGLPKGYQPIPGQNALVNPETRDILWMYHGRWVPSPQSAAGQPATDEQLENWGVKERKKEPEPEPGPTPEEEAQGQSSELVEILKAELAAQNARNAETWPMNKRLLELQLAAAERALKDLEETPAQKEIRELSEQWTLARLRGEAPPISPQQAQQIDELYGTALKEGQEDLMRFGQEMAASRGMTLTDSPISAAVMREAQKLERGMQAAKTAAKLDVGQAQQAFQQGLAQFQQSLGEQARTNRMALVGGLSPTAIPAPDVGAAAGLVTANLNRFSAERLAASEWASREQIARWQNQAQLDIASSDRRQRQREANQRLWGTVIEGAGKAIAAYFGASSARVKRDIAPLDPDEYDRALAKVRETPIVRYRYRWEGDPPQRVPHIGPILELSPPEIREDRLHVNLLDIAGLEWAALKALDRKVDRFAAALTAKPVKGRRVA